MCTTHFNASVFHIYGNSVYPWSTFVLNSNLMPFIFISGTRADVN